MIIIIFNINYLLDILNHFLYAKILLNKNSLEKLKITEYKKYILSYNTFYIKIYSIIK